MSRNIEESPHGYPGFLVSGPARLSRTAGTLKRVALAKLTDVRFFSATFGGEDLLFEPWVTALVDNGASMRLIGVYRTELSADDDEPDSPELPTLCVRRSEWVRDTDIAQFDSAEDPREYLANGPQVSNTLVFGTSSTHPEAFDATNYFVSALAPGAMISGGQPRAMEWHEITVEFADERLTTTLNYATQLAKCEVLETHLLPWLEDIDKLSRRAGLTPDSEVTLSIRRSVPELLQAPLRATTTG